jgi:uncharacterized protein YoxC
LLKKEEFMASSVSILDILTALEPTGFSSPNASIVLGAVASSFIITMGALFVYGYKERVLEYNKREKVLADILSQLESPANEQVHSTKTWDTGIGPNFEKVDWLASKWNAYRSQCWEKNNEIASLSDAEDYFSMVEPPPKGFSSQVAGILTSIGILGTFIGITVGLGKIGMDMGSGSAGEMQSAMSSLISSLGVSFRTSIWGLISSMTITALSNKAESRLETQRQRLVTWLNETMPQKSERALMVEQSELAEKQLLMTKKHIDATEGIGDIIASKIEEAINGPKGLKGSIDKMVEIISESQSEGLDRLVNEFMDQMKDSMNADFSELGGALRDMADSNKGFQVSMSKLIDHLQGATNNQGAAAEQMQEALRNAAMSIAEMKDSLGSLGNVSGDIQEAAVAMQKVMAKQMNQSASQQSTIDNMMGGMNEQTDLMMASHKEITEAGTAISKKFSSLAEALEGLVVWHDRVKGSLDKQIGSFLTTIDAQERIASKMAEERDAVLASVRQLSFAQADLAPAAKAISGAGESVKKASDSLFSTEKSLRHLTKSITDATSDLTDRQIQALDNYQVIIKLLKQLDRK